MQIFKTVGKSLLVAGAIMMLAAPVIAAEKRADSGGGGGDRIRTPNRTRTPGDCKVIGNNLDARLLVINGPGAGDGSGPIETCTCIGLVCFCGGEA